MGQSASKTSVSSSRSAPSTLEELLRTGRWDDARSFLRTPDGQKEVVEGLTSYRGRSKLVTSALFTAVFHRAPLDVIETIYDMKPDEIGDAELRFALESCRPDDGRRRYHFSEHESVVIFLGERCPTGAFLKSGGSGHKDYTPLGHGVENRDVSARIVRYLCFKEPDAIDKVCHFDGEALLPIHLSLGQAKDKRDLLLLGSNFFRENGGVSWEKVPIPNPTLEDALVAASKREDWELVRDLLPDAIRAGVPEAMTSQVAAELERHDAKVKADADGEAWRRRNFGPVMYQVDVLRDLVSPFVPKSSRGRTRTGNLTG